jgi:hypothetical protein
VIPEDADFAGFQGCVMSLRRGYVAHGVSILLFLACTALLCPDASAEVYGNIGYLDTLGDVRAKYPNANFQKIRPAWAQEDDALYQITGVGLSGTIVVKFFDSRPMNRKLWENATDESMKEAFRQFSVGLEDNMLGVQWVRWVPASPIPLARFVSKYGAFQKAGFREDDLTPYRYWMTKGLSVFLSDDEKNVRSVEYEFTNADKRRAFQEKFGSVPDWLKEAE